MNRAEILGIGGKIKKQPHLYPGIEIKGVSIHIGSQLLSLSPLNDAFGRVRKLIDELNTILPEPVSFVDLGGCVGIAYKNEKTPVLGKYCKIIHKHFGKGSGLKNPLKIILDLAPAIS